MSPFWGTFIVGAIVGIFIFAYIVWIVSMCQMASHGDRHLEKMGKK